MQWRESHVDWIRLSKIERTHSLRYPLEKNLGGEGIVYSISWKL